MKAIEAQKSQANDGRIQGKETGNTISRPKKEVGCASNPYNPKRAKT